MIQLKKLAHILIVDSIKSVYEHLTYESKDAKEKNKYLYDKNDILHISDFDIERYITLDESQKRELRNLLVELINNFGIVSLKELTTFLDWKGQVFGVSSRMCN